MRKAFIAAVAALLASPAISATLIDNARGIQVGADGKLERFSGLLISDQGKVVQVLRNGGGTVLPYDRRVDLGGRTVLPGLIDAHGHVIDAPGGVGLGLALAQLDLTGTQSLAELQQRLAAYAEAHPEVPWIIGRGWNQELWPNKTFPTAADLDSIVSGRPVVLERVDGHAFIVNSAAMRAAGVTALTKAPQGGRIENGLFVDNAMDLVDKAVPAPSEKELDEALARAQQMLLSNGITAVGSMSTSATDWSAMRRAAEAGRLQLRLMVYADGLEPRTRTPPPTPWLYADRLRLVGIKFYLDGALGSRGATLKQPYADKPDTHGLSLISETDLARQAEEAVSAGYQIAVHAIGDAANAQAISAFETLSRQHGQNRRWRIEHFQIADPADIPRLKSAGIIASMQPTHQTSDRTMAEKRLGPDRLAGAYAWQTVIKSGARIAFGSDFPVESPNPFPGLAAAISRQDMNGQPPGGWLPEQRVSFEQALSGFTRDAAYAGFAEQKFGALEPGKWADFIIVDRDVSAADPQALAATQVLETWVAGKKVWSGSASAAGERGK